MSNNIQKQIQELRQQIEQWNYEYYVLDNPSVSDAVYDKAVLKLKTLEQQFPEYKTIDSPTNRVGGYVSEKFVKRKHLAPMLSLDNAFSQADLAKFNEDVISITKTVDYVIEPKIDGLSISLIYENSKLVRAVTRGDGVYGEDVTANVYTIKSIPTLIHKKYAHLTVEVRGEVFIDKQEFKKINDSLENHQKKFANPRNAAAGSLRNLDSSVCASRNLKAYFYYSPTTKELGIKTQMELINWLKANKFPVSQEISEVDSFDKLTNKIEEFLNLRDKLDYQIDGIVIKTNQYKYYDEIGYTSKFPKWAIAYKFPAEIGLTKLINIFGDVGRTGKITYVAEVEPINLDGSTVSRVTLNNADYIAAKDIRINDYVFIYKAGDVIPYLDFVDLTRRKKDGKPFQEYKHCPSCQSELVRLNHDVDQRCINPKCPTQIVKKIAYYCERDCMDIVGLSEAIVTKFYQTGLVKNIVDLYLLKNKKAEVLALDLKIKDKLFNNIVTSIENSKTNSLEKLLNALSIRFLGKNTAKIIAKHFQTIEAIQEASLVELNAIYEIGTITAQEIFDWFKNEDNISLIKQLKACGVNTNYLKSQSFNSADLDEKYFNKKIVITGSFSLDRNKIKQYLEDHYAIKIMSTVSKNTDYLLVGENPGDKLNKAKELGIEIIDDLSILIKDIKGE